VAYSCVLNRNRTNKVLISWGFIRHTRLVIGTWADGRGKPIMRKWTENSKANEEQQSQRRTAKPIKTGKTDEERKSRWRTGNLWRVGSRWRCSATIHVTGQIVMLLLENKIEAYGNTMLKLARIVQWLSKRIYSEIFSIIIS